MDPGTPPRQHLTRDQTIQIQTLCSVGQSYKAITSHLSVTVRQVQNACTRDHPTPIKRPGRPSQLTTAQIEELIEYITHSKQSRRQSWLSLSQTFKAWNVSEYVIRTALRTHGFQRYCARRKPPISEKNRLK